ncbi:MAG: hypothetical protein L6R41_003030 [Letrouitia leprolyta]|nr:MAG: hypothetical protein L6R41_003030 [Letrouitia leprolyta]
MASATASMSSEPVPETYFTYSGLSSLMLAHVGLMLAAWFFVLPIGSFKCPLHVRFADGPPAVMLSVARSRSAPLIQLGFLALNSLGLLLGLIYNRKTPKLYEENLHHKLGWIITFILLVHFVVGLLRFSTNEKANPEADNDEGVSFMPISTDHMNGYQQMHPESDASMHRYSHDSGHGTEYDSRTSNSLTDSHEGKDEQPREYGQQLRDDYANNAENPRWFGFAAIDRALSSAHQLVPSWLMKLMSVFYDAVNISILVIGFVLILSGLITYAGIFKGSNIFNGLAHSVKGGIFFWYGLLTLGRWMGCFAEYGWSWNVRPPAGMVSTRKAKMPSAEFVESFVIFLYGSTNVFLEHLAAWGDKWTAEDLEHVSISVMFLGGGLCGMLIESRRVRDLLNASLARWNAGRDQYPFKEQCTPPKTYSFSMNPMPGLIILLLGLMMSSHHQHSMISTMVHKQWGSLFVGFALARAVTYILMYLSPPSSYLPSRPPSEIVSSFCLISGGLIFIASNKDTVAAMERHNINAMFIFTVTMGWTAFLMAWQLIVLAIKGWAVQKRHSKIHTMHGTLA